MGKPLPSPLKQELTSLSPEPQRSPAGQAVIATTSQSSAVAETATEAPPAYKFNMFANTGELIAGARVALGTAWQRQLYRSPFWQRSLNGPAPDRILVNPRSFHPKSIAEAELLIMGRFRLPGGDATARDGSPFFIKPPSEQWAEALHSFHWLRHFDAGGSEPVQEHLRQLIAHWVRTHGAWHDIAWRPHVTARRLMTWAAFGRLILANADVLFRSRVLLSMARQARHLLKTAKAAPAGIDRLVAAIGLVQSGVFLPDGDARMAKGLHMLSEELGEQILPDGGHISRNPESVLSVASDLLSLVDAMTQRDLIVPVTIRRALDRMMPMIRFMLHGDGKLALFNGSTEGVAGWAPTLLSYDTGRTRETLHSAQGGYHRIACGQTLIIADCGVAPPGEMSQGAHAGALSFELSAGEERIVVNGGTAPMKGAEWVQAMRATAAHSTLTVADTSSAHIVNGAWARRLLGVRLTDGPTRIEHKRQENEAGILLNTSHDGYVKPFALVHERDIFAAHDGNDIRGEDRLIPRGPAAPHRFAVRFHLHPSVKAARASDRKSVVLTLPSGATWRFGADAEIDLADGVYLGSGDAIRKTQQIVISGITGGEPTTVKWALKKATGIEAD
jgi:uncharacterized heparinase superfamily protein